VCPGCFAPYPYLQPADARFAAVTQLNTGSGSNYNGLQLTSMMSRTWLARAGELHLEPLP
jgi:hypothetical protein